MKKEYAVYKGDELIVIGTAEECASYMGVTPAYIRWLARPVAKKRRDGRKNPEKCMTAIVLDGEEDESEEMSES